MQSAEPSMPGSITSSTIAAGSSVRAACRRPAAPPEVWTTLVAVALRLRRAGLIDVRGLGSHSAGADRRDELCAEQLARLERAIVQARRLGLPSA